MTDNRTGLRSGGQSKTPDQQLRTSEELATNSRSQREFIVILALSAAAIIYATVRYNVFKGVLWADWPAYTINKALAVASLLMIVASVFRMRRPGRPVSTLMLTAGGLALAHSLLSFALVNPGYYERLFADGKLTFLAGLSLTLGAGIMAVMEIGARRGRVWSPGIRHNALALTAFATGVHAALPATASWITPATWPGGMPPLTMLSFLAGVCAIVAWRWR
jgi:uncharacterized membrane protein YqjE